MRMKVYVLAALAGVLGLASCNDDFLDKTVTTDLDESTIFADSTYAAGFLTQIYIDIGFDTDLNRWGDGGGLQVACDEAEFKQSSSITTGMAFATGTINPMIVSDDAWRTCYTNIRRVNKFLQKIGDVPMIESTKQRYIYEARFLRAWYYNILLRHYGGIPLQGDTVYTATDKVNAVRNTYEECVNYIISECNAVLDADVLRPRTEGRNNGRICEADARALISRVTLDAASPLHNGSDFGTDSTKLLVGYPTYDRERWHTAYQAAKNFMLNNSDYRLYEMHVNNDNEAEPGWGYYAINMPEDYRDTKEGGGFSYDYGPFQEIILEKKATNGYTVLQTLCPKTCGGGGAGGYIYADLCDAYPMIDGKPIGESKYEYDPLHPNVNRDPRFFNNVTYNGYVQRNGNDENYVVRTYTGDNTTQDEVHSGTPTGYYIHKFVNRNCAGNYWAAPPMGRNLMRFAEILLNYAEAANEYYGPDFSETLGDEEMSPYRALELIRRRAGIEAGDDGLYGLKANMTQEEMRQAIRDERRIELAFEGFRFFDERRWMIADQVENAPMHGFEITRTGNDFTYRTFVVRNHVFRRAEYFFPIPYQEVSKSPELIQNPYYE